MKDVIKKIETTFEKTGFDYSPIRKNETIICNNNKTLNVPRIAEDTVIEENLLVPTKILELERQQNRPENEEKANEPKSVSKLEIVLQKPKESESEELPFNPNSQLFMRRKAALNQGQLIQTTVYRESIVSSLDIPVGEQTTIENADGSTTPIPGGSSRKKKLTTRVTVNMRKISRRSSDVGLGGGMSNRNSTNLDEDLPSSGSRTPVSGINAGSVRHSCGNELLKTLTKLRLVADQQQQNQDDNQNQGVVAVAQNDNLSGRSSVVPAKNLKFETYVCCNCGNSMTPADLLQSE